MSRIGQRVAVALLVGLVSLMASADETFITPGDNLVVDGIPKIPRSIADKTSRYTAFRTATLQSWHPSRREMLILTRFADSTQVHIVRQPLGVRSQLTFFPDRVVDAAFNPAKGDYFLFRKDKGGDEWFQIYRYDVATADITLLTDGKSRNGNAVFDHQGTRVAYTSTRRNNKDTDIWVMDPQHPKTDHLIAQADSGRWFPVEWSHDGKWIVANEVISDSESYLWMVDAAIGAKRRLIDRDDEPVAYRDVRFSPADAGAYLTSDKGSEFRRLVYLDLATKKTAPLTAEIPWDIEEFALSHDGRRLAFTTNEDGVSRLYLLDTATRQFHPIEGLPSAVLTDLVWRGSTEIGFSLNSARTPTDAYSYNPATKALTRWTESETGGLNTTSLPNAQLVKWKTFDSKDISGFLYMPPSTFTGKRPVIVNVHGGPESQARPTFIGRSNYFLNELGIAIVYPNVRGSSGYGKTFLAADNGFHREDSYKDMAALFDWIKQDPRLDGDRILVTGGSYGGHMTLVAATHYSDRIRATVDVVGISNLVTFLEHTESYRRDYRRSEYGDERDPKMRAYQESVAPMNRVKNISKPMLIIAGRNDPRVPISESDQIAAAVKANGTPRWYLVANDEGHGYAKRSNQDFQFYATVLFVEKYLVQ